ncbi:MAG: HlyD family efflux transporter periplasmic adaptor subunit [Nitrospinae bacterium]|nr:HlyD family efflux transporter periplasmic adaptor subunit [Nitrospinota bacterium]
MEGSAFYRHIVNGISSGVMSLNPDGVVTSFNPMASRITGLAAETVVGKKFSELILALEGADEFFDVIFEAVYDASVVHQRTVEATFGNRRCYLSVTTTYLEEEGDGGAVRAGVLAVFEDLSEIRELHIEELRLKKELEAKHGKLLDAFREIEAGNRRLREASRKVRALRLGAAAFAVLLLATLGAYVRSTGWLPGGQARVETSGSLALPVVLRESPATRVVAPQRVYATISVAGRLAPRRQVEITAPLEGKVAAVSFRYGHRVREGQTLMEFDVEPTRIKHRRARVEHIKARKRLGELEDLSSNVAVSRARRAVERSRTDLQASEEKLSNAAFLLGRGLIPASEHEAAKRTHHNHRLNVESAELDLKVILADAEINREAARLEVDNARSRMEELAGIIRRSKVKAPVSGVVMRPGRGARASGRPVPPLTKGASVKPGDYLLSIGDLSGLRVVGNVDEVDIVRIRAGQAVTITGDAFPGLDLRGEIAEVSRQAVGAGRRRGHSRFEVAAVVEELTAAQRKALRLGMSARLRIVVYDKPDALVVPIGAVDTQSRPPRLLVKDKDTGEARPVEVATGVTTVSGVEILEGLEAGDEIILPPR